MLAAAHFDNLLVLLFFAIAIFFQILSKAASKGRRRPPDTRRKSTSESQMSRPLPREEQETDADQIRKFLEALGQPTTSKAPPPVAPRPTYQRPVVVSHIPPYGSPLPPLKTRPPDLPEVQVPTAIAPKREAKVVRPPIPEAPAFEVHHPRSEITELEVKVAFQPAAKQPAAKVDIVTMLRSTAGLRDAIILREIFGPPRSMQPLDLVGNV